MWVKKYPSSYQAFLVRGIYNENLAWKRRGTKYAKDTTKEQFDGFDFFLQKSIEDLKLSVKLKPDLGPAYWYLVETHMGLGGKDKEIAEYYKAGIDIDPASYHIRFILYSCLKTKMGRGL